MITLVLGGTRSGKSVVAERLVLAHPGALGYLATGAATDADMTNRIEWHRRRRDARFETIEVGGDLAAALRRAPTVPVLVDALGTWVAGQPEFAEPATAEAGADPRAVAGATGSASLHPVWAARIDELCAALQGRGAPTVLVSDEVGMGVHPETAVGRLFRDVLGLVNQRVAETADDVLLVVAGRALHLDRLESHEHRNPDPGSPAP